MFQKSVLLESAVFQFAPKDVRKLAAKSVRMQKYFVVSGWSCLGVTVVGMVYAFLYFIVHHRSPTFIDPGLCSLAGLLLFCLAVSGYTFFNSNTPDELLRLAEALDLGDSVQDVISEQFYTLAVDELAAIALQKLVKLAISIIHIDADLQVVTHEDVQALTEDILMRKKLDLMNLHGIFQKMNILVPMRTLKQIINLAEEQVIARRAAVDQ